MMAKTRFYKPSLAVLTDKELAFAKESLERKYAHWGERSVPEFDFLLPIVGRPIMDRNIAMRFNRATTDFSPEYFDMGPFQVTYNFSDAVRKNNFPVKNALFSDRAVGEYGAPGWSFRMLYEFLCEVFNGGVPFVDTYFGQLFKTRPVYRRFLSIYDDIQQDIDEEQVDLYANLPLKADGTPDMRYTASKRFKDFRVWQDPIIRQGCQRVAGEIRADIETCLRTGRLPLRSKEGATVSHKTREMRSKLGGMVHANRLFFASGQLIRNLNIYVEIGAKGARAA